MPEHDDQRAEQAYSRSLESRASKGSLRAETVDRTTATEMVARVLEPLQPGTYLEIGPGFNPYISGTSRQFGTEQRYIAFDGGESRYQPNPLGLILGWVDPRAHNYEDNQSLLVRKFESANQAPNKELRFVDAQNLDLPDADPTQPEIEKVKEIYMNSVLIAPGMHRSSITAIVRECARVLQANGQLLIRDELMPGDLGGTDFLELFDILDKAGFTKRALVTVMHSSRTMEELSMVYDGPGGSRLHPWEGSYIICEKGQEGVTPAVDPRRFGQRFTDLFRNWG